MLLTLTILIGWLLLSVPAAFVLGRMLRAADVAGDRSSGSQASRRSAAPPAQRGSGAGPRAA